MVQGSEHREAWMRNLSRYPPILQLSIPPDPLVLAPAHTSCAHFPKPAPHPSRTCS